MRRIILIFAVVLPVFLLMGGCDSGGGYSGYREYHQNNEKTIHYDVDVTDWAAVMRAQNEQQRMLQEQSRETLDRMKDTTDQMFGIPPSRQFEHDYHRH